MMLNIQFADATEEVIVSYFGGPQDPEFYPHQGQVDTSDPRWHAYYEATPMMLRIGLPEPTAAV